MKFVSVMQLFAGCEAEYQRRHDALWPELAAHLSAFGIVNYHIYLHPTTLQLFATFEAPEKFNADALAADPIMQKWWDHMADIMATGATSNAPVAIPLQQVFAFNQLPALLRTSVILDIGKTNIKLSAINAHNGQAALTVQTPNRSNTQGAYPSVDTEAIWQWLTEQLKQMASRFDITTIGITTHGATAACMANGKLALPIIDYEYEGIASSRTAYDDVRPEFDETLSPKLPAGLNLGAQLFWLQQHFPTEMARVDQVLLYPQYWVYRLCGVAASEVTSLACHTDLWQPEAQSYSSLITRMGWQHWFAQPRPPGAAVGNVGKKLAAELGLPSDCQVHNGIHDSNASLVPHLLNQSAPFAVVSSGTWTVIAGIGSPMDCLDPSKDMLANVNALGMPTPSLRFMGGREWQAIAGTDTAKRADLQSLLAKAVFALPTFSSGVGPFADRSGKFVGDYAGLTEAEKSALACLYLALLTHYGLTLLQQNKTVIIEGSFAKNEVLLTCLASLGPGQRILVSQDVTGTTGGTAMLCNRHSAADWPYPLTHIKSDALLADKILTYQKDWQSLCNSPY